MSNHEYGGLTAARALKAEGVECMFGVIGSMDLVCEEAEQIGIKHYVTRHEQSGGFAADGFVRRSRAHRGISRQEVMHAPHVCVARRTDRGEPSRRRGHRREVQVGIE